MLELRKDLFADERDDNLEEIGKRHAAPGHARPCHRHQPLLRRSPVRRPAASQVLRSPHHHARIRGIDTAAAERAPGVRRVIRGADVPVNLNTLLSLLEFGKDDEPSLAVDKVRYRGEPIVAVVADSEREALGGARQGRVEYELLPAVLRRRGGDQARRARGQRGLSEEHLSLSRPVRPPEAPLRRRGGGLCDADHVLEERYQMSPIEHAPTETNGSIAAPETNGRYIVYTGTQALFFSLDTSAQDPTFRPTGCISSAARWAAGSVARSTRSPSRWRSSPRC